jgi:hypothetical protein
MLCICAILLVLGVVADAFQGLSRHVSSKIVRESPSMGLRSRLKKIVSWGDGRRSDEELKKGIAKFYGKLYAHISV